MKGASSGSHTSVSYTLRRLKCHCDILYDNQSPLPTLDTTFRDQESFKCHRRSVLDTDPSQLLLNVTVQHQPSTTAHVSGSLRAWPSNTGDCIGFGTSLSHTGLPYSIFFGPLIHVEQLKQCREIADPLASRVVFQPSAH